MRRLARALVYLVAAALAVLGLAISLVETGWAKNRLRAVLVRQANEYLSATLAIDRLEGSLVRGIQLGDIDLSRDGRSLIHIDEVALSYSLREVFQSGTVIRHVRLTRPRVSAARLADGKWDLGALIKRERREERRTGPGRPIEIQSIEVVDGHISLHDALDFGAAHLPTEFAALNAAFSFVYYPVRWHLAFDRLSWIGRVPDLTVTRLSGTFGLGPGGWFFDKLSVQTPRSGFQLDGRVIVDDAPAELDLAVHAERFAFQEWSGVLRGLKNIAVEASFDTSLKGPLRKLETDIRLAGNGGSVHGHLILDTSIPGWHGAGAVDLERLDLARWLDRPNRPSDITGHVTFDLALELGRHFPRGVYAFNGAHAMYMGYAGDQVNVRGQIVSTEVQIASAIATAYGARVTTTNGSIGLDEPFPYRFQGLVTQIDLRNVPPTIPVPRVESLLTFDYDVSGRFSDPAIAGQALFARSTFLGATIQPGTSGSIDTLQKPLRFTGDGEISDAGVRRLGEGLDIGWMQDPRYAGTLSGRFHVDGVGSGRETLTLNAGGRVTHGEMFHGAFSNADVSLWIEQGSLRASYSGHFTNLDPAVPFDDSRLEASLTGDGTVAVAVRALLTRRTTVADYDIGGSLALGPSTIRGLALSQANIEATLRNSSLSIAQVSFGGPAIEGHGSGTIVLPASHADDADGTDVAARVSDFEYDMAHIDLAQLEALTGHVASGDASTKGHVSGPWRALRAIGDGSIARLDAFDVQALTLTGHYDVTVPSGTFAKVSARLEGHGAFLTVSGQEIRDVSGTIALDAERVEFDLGLANGRQSGRVTGRALIRTEEHTAEFLDLAVRLGNAPWRLTHDRGPARVTWKDGGVAVTPVTFVAATGDQRIDVWGDWQPDGTGALHVKTTHLFLDGLETAFGRPARYGGVLDLDATVHGTRERPLVSGTIAVTNGRVERVNYQSLKGRIDYGDRSFTIDLRVDQAPGIWITAQGRVPFALLRRSLPAQPLDVSLKSSSVDLGLVQGVTNVVQHVSGQLQMDLKAVGTSHDPRLVGSVSVTQAAFQLTASGAAYKNARAMITLTEDRINVDTLHIEDASGHPLEVHGSLGTHELEDLRIDVNADRFETFRNEFGRMDIDARLQIRGRSQSPRLAGDVTIHSGQLHVDEILQRAVFQPYATEPTSFTGTDAIAALNLSLWDRLGMDLSLHVPNTLRLAGEDVQVSPGTPVGIGNINLRVAGDLYFYKDPTDRLYVTGAFDSVSGTYGFQGRRFDVSPNSSIIFRGDPSPDLYVGVTRVISGVEVRVGLIGPMRQPELRLASTPPLDESEILSLVVFNTTTNQLTAAQQQNLFVRAGALAAGFVAAPLVSAVENKLGLDVLEVEPGSEFGPGTQGPKVTVGEEVAPGLLARFSRQFGSESYDQATIEYYLSRILRLRATFSDAQALSVRSPFRRVERAGIDLLFFFSF